MNALGFVSSPLYLFGHYWEGKPTEWLLGKGVTPGLLNDDRMGRMLDTLSGQERAGPGGASPPGRCLRRYKGRTRTVGGEGWRRRGPACRTRREGLWRGPPCAGPFSCSYGSAWWVWGAMAGPQLSAPSRNRGAPSEGWAILPAGVKKGVRNVGPTRPGRVRIYV